MTQSRATWAATLMLAFAGVVGAQTAQITGRVIDSSNAVLPRVAITVTNVETGIERATRTNDEGYYTVPLLRPGRYRVSLRFEGFRPVVQDGITLEVDQVARLDFTMEVGAVSESVEVIGEAPLVDSSSATVGKVVENRRIADLPLNGRNALALVMLMPGVRSQAGPTNSGFSDRGIALSSISINGGVDAQNNFMLDGNTNNNTWNYEVNVNPAVDAVEEFKVQTNTMSAEYGFTSGGIINIVTKSGTNQLHGSLYEFVRNEKFDARNAFALTRPPFRYNQFGGAVGGPVYLPRLYNGRNRTFFFFNYEEWRYRQYATAITTVPTAVQRQGDFSELRDSTGQLIPIFDPATTRANPDGAGFIRDMFPGNVLPANRLDPVAQKALVLIPLPNRAPANVYTNQNNFMAELGTNMSMRQYTAKIDHRLSDRNSIYWRYTYFRHFSDGGMGGSPFPDPATRQRYDTLEPKNFLLSDTHVISPHMLNEFRAGAARLHFTFVAASYGQDWPRKLGLPESIPSDVLPRMSIGGMSGFSQSTVGLRATLAWQFFDMVTANLAAHTLKIGADFRPQQAHNIGREIPSGSFTFAAGLTGNPQRQTGTGSGFATFLLGAVSSGSMGTYLGQSNVGYSASFFVQDDWKVTPRLTVNLGLRYDYQAPPVERHNGQSNFNPYAINPENGLPGRMEYAGIDYGRSAWQSDRNNFSPRVGFAYDLLGNKKAVLRGGYGILRPSIFYYDFFGSNAGFAVTNTTYGPAGGNSNLPAFQLKNGFPYPPTPPLGSKLGPGAFLSTSVGYNQTTNKYPMSQQWNLSLQQQLPGGWLVDATYSGNHATHLLAGGYDYNQMDEQYWSLGLSLQDQVSNPYAGRVPGAMGGATLARSQSLRPYPYYSGVTVRFPNLGNSIYHAFLLSVEKRLSKGLALLASYTNAKLISDSVQPPVNFGPVEQIQYTGYQNGKFNRRAERSLDPTDVSQRFVLSAVYELPFGKGKRWGTSRGVAEKFIGGWQINTVTTLQGGLPIPLRGASNYRADRPNSTGTSAHVDARSTQRWFDPAAFVNPPDFTLGNVGRVLPDVRSPGVANVDFSLIKDTSLHERLRLQIRAEAFNVANTVNLGYPNSTFQAGPDGGNRNALLGVISSSRAARIMQFGLKLIF